MPVQNGPRRVIAAMRIIAAMVRGARVIAAMRIIAAMAYDARLVVKSKLHYFAFIKDRLDQPRRSMFNDTCFGPWLNLSYVDNEEGLVHYMLQKQFHQKDESYDLPLVYYLNGHSLAFGRQEFCLITGFRFGIVSFRKWRYGQIPFRDRVFPHKVGQHVKLIDLFQIIEDEEVFIKLSDDDAIRVCLLLTLDVIFMGKDLGSIVDDIFLRMVEDLDEWNAFPWGEHVWRQLYDSIRNVSSKHIPGYREITGVNESKDLPTYSLNGFVAAFKIWIIESSDKSKNWWNKTPGVIPRALAWSKHTSLRQTDYFDQLFAKDSKPNLVVTPSGLEAEAEWYTRSQEFFKWYTPRAPPLAKGGHWDQFFQKAAEKKSRHKSITEGSLVESRGKDVEVVSLEQRVKDLECRTFKLETVIQVITSDRKKLKKDSDEKVVDLADEYCSEVNEFINLFDSPFVDVDNKADGLNNVSKAKLEEAEKQEFEEHQMDKSPKMSDEVENRRKLIEKLNSPPIKRVIEKCGYKKRRCEDVVRPPYVEKKSKTSEVPSAKELRGRKKIQDPVIAEKLLQVRPWVERIHVSYEMDRFFLSDGWRNCMFPWSDLVVDRYFWDALLGLDANRKGWLRDEHIDLWISYMWHTRPSDMDWSMVSSFFLPLLMKGTMPVWYANKETYPLGWGEVERVFIPINEPELHWSLAEFHIQTGRVTFIDSGPVYENEMRPYYLSVRNCLATRLPELLEQVGVFEQKEIDSNTYKITFNNAKNVPKQGGVFDDCGVWLCIFLFRLGNGKLLDVDNPVQVALAYRERLLRFYYKHKIHVA
ncbi:phospholipase-like protein [Artemisia annua]|uniref:Phospholipase-like protein n=1 Tax=Artemisia annua TaxID=35608 RepID=A0A2U1N3V7_ARTAN|nr:phospholipase-like protein [Artemisia annua]